MNTMDIRQARQEYEDLGIDTIPLRPGTKVAMRRNWQTLDPTTLWQGVPDDANIGLRGGGDASIAFVDCDEKNQPGTYDKAVSWLAGLGYLPGDYPLIQTASQVGRQIYVTFAGGLPGHTRNLASEFGAGEFRYGPGAYVVAPPSQVGESVYILIDGDYRQLPRLALDDVLPILGNKNTTPDAVDDHPTMDKLPNIPRRVRHMLDGKNLESYKSRSEAEQSIIASLVNAGHSFDSVLGLFMRYPCAGKFAELSAKSVDNAIRWLRHSYDEAVEWTSKKDSKTRRSIAAMLIWAKSTPWPGRTGATDRAVFVAHCQIAYRAGRLVYAASCRDLAERAGVSYPTASKATSRICSVGLVSIETLAVAHLATMYRLNVNGQDVTLPNYYKGEGVLKDVHQHDAFRKGKNKAGLGKSAGLIWEALQDGLATEKELAHRTGRDIRTVKRNLAPMSRLADTVTGEFVPMVEKIGDQWHALDGVDLDHVAQVVGTAGAGKRQQERHRQERRAHRRALENWGEQTNEV